MHPSLSTRYDPSLVEQKWYAFWEQKGYFHADPAKTGLRPFTIVIPPPNVTGVLTMGHVLNNTIQDILIRWRRMQGFNALWVPGSDHAGIATQNVVERDLAREGLTRDQLGRERFIQRVWQKKEANLAIINQQLRRLGCSLDWPRERFTMDEGLSRAVLEVFRRLYDKGLVYRGKFMINWCPRCHTALSDEESIHQEHQGKLTTLKYPIIGTPDFIEVATTRPETMLGDTAVAVNPGDERYRGLVGRKAMLPLMEREIPIIADEHVDPQFGTGAVKVTPAHDPNDFEIAQRHRLPSVTVIGPDGKMTKDAGKYAGTDRLDCRKAVLRDLAAKGLIAGEKDYLHSVAHCQRCDTVIEPLYSTQWFVRMKPLAQPAIDAVRSGRIRVHPPRWEKVYYDWMENIRDWCISRQIWWGHRIPAWYCDDCEAVTVSISPPAKCSRCGGANLRQDEDVLDTWASSWLWPFSTLGWPDDTPELRYFYPTDVLVTAPDIIFFWVARMIMAGMEFLGDIPFTDVYFHGIVRDEQGRKMSKSLGNSPDPVAVMDEFGSDALRFSIILITAQGQDAFYGREKVEIGRNFANKIWNAARLVLSNLGDVATRDLAFDETGYRLEDRWILSRLAQATGQVTRGLETFNLNDAARTLYDFIWHELCDWYLEIVKPRLYAKDDAPAEALTDRHVARCVLSHVLDCSMRLLHPIAPFITEEIWQKLNELVPQRGRTSIRVAAAESVTIAPWPQAETQLVDAALDAEMTAIQQIIRAVRNVRAKVEALSERQPLPVIISTASNESVEVVRRHQEMLVRLANIQSLDVGTGIARPPSSAVEVLDAGQVFVPLRGLIDLDAERQRLQARIEQTRQQLEQAEAKLANEGFVRKAPPAVVERERARHVELAEKLKVLEANLTDMQ